MTTTSGTVSIQEELFRDLLPRIRDLAQIKAVLYVAYFSARDHTLTVPLDSLMEHAALRDIVGLDSPEPAGDRLKAGLDRAVADGTLLRLVRRTRDRVEVAFALGTDENAQAVHRMMEGDDAAAAALSVDDGSEVTVYRPNVYALYERSIGPLTPLVAERLRDAERSYPRAWVERAFDEAVHYNRRNWRYIEAILARWEETGGPDGISE